MVNESNLAIKICTTLKKVLTLIGLFFLYQVVSVPFLIGSSEVSKAKGGQIIEAIMLLMLGFFGVVGAAWLCYWLYKKLPPIQRYWSTPQHPVATFLKFVLALVLFQLLYVGVRLTYYFHGQIGKPVHNQLEIIRTYKAFPIAEILILILIAPVIEELIFRGLLMKFFFENQSTMHRIIITVSTCGLIFALIHVTPTNVAFIEYLYVACLLSTAYCYFGKLRYSIGLHMINNLLATIPLLFT